MASSTSTIQPWVKAYVHNEMVSIKCREEIRNIQKTSVPQERELIRAMREGGVSAIVLDRETRMLARLKVGEKTLPHTTEKRFGAATACLSIESPEDSEVLKQYVKALENKMKKAQAHERGLQRAAAASARNAAREEGPSRPRGRPPKPPKTDEQRRDEADRKKEARKRTRDERDRSILALATTM